MVTAVIDIKPIGKLLAYQVALIGWYVIGLGLSGSGWATPILIGAAWFSACHIIGRVLVDSGRNEKQEKYLYYLQKQQNSSRKKSD